MLRGSDLGDGSRRMIGQNGTTGGDNNKVSNLKGFSAVKTMKEPNSLAVKERMNRKMSATMGQINLDFAGYIQYINLL